MIRVIRTMLVLILTAWSSAAAFIPTQEPTFQKEAATSQVSQAYVPDELILRLKAEEISLVHLQQSIAGQVQTGLPSLDNLNNHFGVRQMESLFPATLGKQTARTGLAGIYRLRLAPGTDVPTAVRAYRQDAHILYAEPNYIYHTTDTLPNDLDFYLQWNLNNTGQSGGTPGADLDMLKAWDLQTGSPNIIIAVIDTGVAYNHVDLVGNIWSNSAEIPGNGLDDDNNSFIDDIHGWDFVTAPSNWVAPGEDYGPPDNNPMDFNGHGTTMAGVAAARSNNTEGMAGICWQCKIMPVRAGYSNQSGGGSLDLSDVVQAIGYAVDNGAHVINMSFGAYESESMREAVAYADLHSVVMIAAAGNNGTDSEFYPAAYPEVFAVAATDSSDRRSIWGEQISSNVGFWVDAAAPGTSIRGTWPGGGYINMDGTSPAAPHAAGLAGLLLSQNPEWSATQVRTALESTVDPLQPDEYIGVGRINAWNALKLTNVPDLHISSPSDNSIITSTIPILGTASGDDFQSYLLEAGSGDYPTNWHTIASSNQPVTGGSLGLWDPSSLPTGIATVRLRVTGLSGGVTHTHIRVLVDHRLLAGWPKPLVVYSPMLVDLNGDQKDEILLGSLDGKVHILDAAGNELPGWGIKIGETLAGSPAAGDLDNDGAIEIAAASRNTSPASLYMWHSNGSPLQGWPIYLTDEVVTALAIGDVNADGQSELVGMTTSESGTSPAKVHIWKSDATELAGWPYSLPLTPNGVGENTTDPCLGDLNNDGKLEIVFGDANGWVHVLLQNQTEMPGWPRMASPDTLNSRYAYAALGDVDGDGTLDVVTVSDSFEARVWKANGDLMPGWPQTIPYFALSRPTLADLDGNGKLEILLHSNNDRIYAWREDGSLLSGYPIELRKQWGNGTWSQLIAADVNADRQIEVLASGDERRVMGWNGQGQSLAGGPFNMMVTSNVSAAIGDIDGDGKLDLVGGDNQQVYAWHTSTPAGIGWVQWGMFQHDPQHTGRFVPQVIHTLYLPVVSR